MSAGRAVALASRLTERNSESARFPGGIRVPSLGRQEMSVCRLTCVVAGLLLLRCALWNHQQWMQHERSSKTISEEAERRFNVSPAHLGLLSVLK